MEDNKPENLDEEFGGFDPDPDYTLDEGPDKDVDPGYSQPTVMAPLAFQYNPHDTLVNDILNQVSGFCGAEFTEVPPNPDGEQNPDYDPEDPMSPEHIGGDIMPLDDVEKPKPGDPDFVIDPDDPDKTGQIDPDAPGEKYPDGTEQEPNPDLDKLREEYKKAYDENLKEKTTYWAKLWQVIRFISNITCWTEQIDDTFITQTRVQYHKIEQVCGCRPGCCHCNEDEIAIPLDYAPLPEYPFIDAEITVFINGQPIVEKIDYKYLNDHLDRATNVLHIIRQDYPKTLFYHGGPCCLCRRKAVLKLRYNAGYDMIPAGLLPMICPLIKKIDESKDGLSDCANTMTQVAGLLASKKVGNIQYTWSDKDSNSAKTQTLYTDLFNLASVAEVNALSRCYIAETPEEMGDVI